MIGKLIFKLPEEKEEFEMAQKAYDYYCALKTFDDKLRAMVKYENNEEARKYRDLLCEITSEYEVDL